PANVGARVVKAAQREVGVLEVPRDSNSGPRVRTYQASTTVPGSGWPWCMAFVRWCWDQAGAHKNGYRGAYVPHLELWARKAGKLQKKPSPGAAILFDWDGDGVADHTGLVERVTPRLVTIEGNTQPGASG